MQAIRFEQYQPDNAVHQGAVTEAARYSQDAQMLPLNQSRIESFDYSVMAFTNNYEMFLGHVGVQRLSHYPALLSGLVKNPDAVGLRIGSKLLEFVATDIPVSLPDVTKLYAFANPDSRELFERHGGVVIGRRAGSVATGCVHIMDLTAMLQPRA